MAYMAQAWCWNRFLPQSLENLDCWLCSDVALMMGPKLLSKLCYHFALCPFALFHFLFVKEKRVAGGNTVLSILWCFCCNCYLEFWYMESFHYRYRNSRTGGQHLCLCICVSDDLMQQEIIQLWLCQSYLYYSIHAVGTLSRCAGIRCK